MTPARGYLVIALAASSWGTWSLFLRTAERWGPLAGELEALVVVATMCAVTLPFALRDGRGKSRSRRAWALLAAMGVTDALNMLLFFRAMRLGTVAVAVLTHSLAPILVAAAAPLFTSERTRARTWIGAAIALAGLTLVLSPWRDVGPGVAACAAAGGGSAVFYAANILLQKRLGSAFSATEVIAYHALPSLAILALAVPAGGFLIQRDQALLLIAGSLGPGALAGVAFVAALTVVRATHAAVVALLEPLVAVIVSVVVWGEPLGALGFVGGATVLAGVLLTVTSARGAPPGGDSELTRSSAAP